MNIKCYKYDAAQEKPLINVGIIDDFISLSFGRNYSSYGKWQLVLNGYSDNAQRVKNFDVIEVNGEAGLVLKKIEDKNKGKYTITYQGIQLNGLTASKVVIPASGSAYLTFTNKSPEYIIANILNSQIVNPEDAGRAIIGSIAAYIESEELTQYSGRFSNVGEDISTIATVYNIGWKAAIEDGTIQWVLYCGKDRTNGQSENSKLIISDKYDTNQISILENIYTIPTFLLVAGQGEGISRTIIPMDDTTVGLRRNEIYVDARDINTSEELTNRGIEKLADYGDNTTYNITLSNDIIYKYKVDYDLGDEGTIVDDRLENGFLDFRITEITEVYESGVIRLDMTLGYYTQTISSALKRISGNIKTLQAIEV